jgi:integrase
MPFKLTIEINCFAVTAVKGRAHALPHRECKAVQNAKMISGLGSPIDQGFTPGSRGWELNPHIAVLQAYNIGFNISNSGTVKIRNMEKTISDFVVYLSMDERLSRRVVRDYKYTIRRFLNHSHRVINRETLRNYLRNYVPKKPSTYNNQLKGLRAFIMRYLGRPEIILGFRKAPVLDDFEEAILPSREQLKQGFSSLQGDKEKAIFMLYEGSGLRRSELLQLQKEDINTSLRSVKSKHNTRTKRARITFYTEETETFLNNYLNSRKDSKSKLFRMDMNTFYKMWVRISERTGMKVTPQVLRKWQSTTLGENGCPDRYVDVFQGRAPKTVLAKFYTGKELQRLKSIYDKFSEGLKILD